jgi:hypothetical protein
MPLPSAFFSMRNCFVPRNVLDEAEAIIRGLIELSLKPRMDLRKIATEELSEHPDPDLLLPFSVACRADLDNLYRTVHCARRILDGPRGTASPMIGVAKTTALERPVKRRGRID